MKKYLVVALTLALSLCLLGACSSEPADDAKEPANNESTQQPAGNESDASKTENKEPENKEPEKLELTDVAMQYISIADAKANVSNADYLFVDLRQPADYDKAHIDGAISASMHEAKDGDWNTGVANMTAALKNATGSETAEGKTLVLICYSGKKYAQAGTNVLDHMGADMSKVFTLEGGMKAWDAA